MKRQAYSQKRSHLFEELMNFITRININKAMKRLPNERENQYEVLHWMLTIQFIYTSSTQKKKKNIHTNTRTQCIDLHVYWKVESQRIDANNDPNIV